MPADPTPQDHERAFEATQEIDEITVMSRDGFESVQAIIADAIKDERERILNEVIAERAKITNGNTQTHGALTRVIVWLRAGAIRSG